MRFNRVLLIKPFYRYSHYDNVYLVAGLAYISSALDKAALPNVVVDMGFGYDSVALINRIKAFEADLIGITMMSFGYKDTFALIDGIKRSFPRVAIVVGGPFVSTLRESVLYDCPGIDYGITLEGEQTIVELCHGDIIVSKIKGLLFRGSAGEVIYTGDREFIEDLDGNGFPTYSRFELDRYPRSITIITSRGCPYQCIYCPVRQAIGQRFRLRSPVSVSDEFEYWYRKGFREFEIADDNFTLDRNRVSEICNELRRRGLSALRISCGNGVRADKVDKDLLIQMKEVGFCYIAFGVEAGNNRILKRLRKGESIEAIEQAISDACALGYRVTLFFLLGSPEETESDVRDSLNLALRYPVYDVRFYNLIPFPGTELYEWVKDNGYFVRQDYLNDASHWVNEPIFETPELSREARIRLYREVNRKAYLHTLPIKRGVHLESVSAKFQRFGVPRWLSSKLAWLYFSPLIQIFLLSKTGSRLKNYFG